MENDELLEKAYVEEDQFKRMIYVGCFGIT